MSEQARIETAVEVTIDNCELFRAQIAEQAREIERLEAEAIYSASAFAAARAELAALKAGNESLRLVRDDYKRQADEYRAKWSALSVGAVVMPEREAVIMKAVGMCNRIPGSTNWNAAEFAYDEFVARLNPSRGVQEGFGITQEQIDRHTTTAWECPPQSLVVLVSSLKRLAEKNAAAPTPARTVEPAQSAGSQGGDV